MLAIQQSSADDVSATGFERSRSYEFQQVGREVVIGCIEDAIVRRTGEPRHVSVAKARRRFDQGVEHRLQIEGRAADHLEHVGGGGLLLQRFAQLVEQARVLDGDHGLGGKIRPPVRFACR